MKIPDDLYVLFGAASMGIAISSSIIQGLPAWDAVMRRRFQTPADDWDRLGMGQRRLTIGLRIWSAGTVLAILGLGWGLSMWPVAITVGFLLVQLPKYVIEELVSARTRLLRDQMVSATGCLASNTEAGNSLAQGLEAVARETPQPLARQFRRIVADYGHGCRLTDAILTARERLQLEPFSLFASAIQVTLARGGRINQALARISHSLREGQRLERKLQSETAAGKRVVQLLAIFPFGFLILLYGLAPQSVALLFTTLPGQFVLAMCILTEYASIRMAMLTLRLDI